MRHRNSSKRLEQKPGHSRMLQRNLLTSLLLYERVRTTRKRAQVVVPLVDRLITIAKRETPQRAIRAINRMVTDKNASRKIMEVLAARFADRPSGMTRTTPLGSRRGDGAHVVELMLIEGKDMEGKKPASGKKPAAKKSRKSAA